MSDDQSPPGPMEAGKSFYEGGLEVLLTGFAILVPVVITIYLIDMTLNLVGDALRPLIGLLRWMGVIDWFQTTPVATFMVEIGLYTTVYAFLTELIAVFIVLTLVVLVGTVGRNRYGELVIDYVDLAISSIPGIGTVYGSFRRMSDAVLDKGADEFKEVKLVRGFGDDLYLLGFETGSSPAAVSESTGNDDMVTMFLPLAPNPVTGGFLTHVPREQVVDVDMTVEEGVRSILTSGVASGEGKDTPPTPSIDQIAEVPALQQLQSTVREDNPGQSDD